MKAKRNSLLCGRLLFLSLASILMSGYNCRMHESSKEDTGMSPKNTGRQERNSTSVTKTTYATANVDKSRVLAKFYISSKSTNVSSRPSLISLSSSQSELRKRSTAGSRHLTAHRNYNSTIGIFDREKKLPLSSEGGFGPVRGGPNGRQNIIRSSDSAIAVARMTYLKKEMCKSEPLEQIIKERGCNRQRIVNRFCYGQCNSFFIPMVSRSLKTDDQNWESEPTASRYTPFENRRRRKEVRSVSESSFRSCSFCKPRKIEWDVITLKCPNTTPPTRRKRFPIVRQCACVALSLEKDY